MKIALVNQPWNRFLPPVESGSIAIWNDRVARLLAGQSGFRVVVLGGTDERDEPRDEDGVRFVPVRLGFDRSVERLRERLKLDRDARRPRLLSTGAYGGFARRVVRALAAERPDVVHLHNLVQLAPRVRAVLPHARVVLHMHCEWLSQLDKRRIASLLGAVDQIACCSDAVAQTARTAHPTLATRIHVVPNGIDPARFVPTTPRTGGGRSLVFVGRISPEKGLHVLLPAFARLCESRSDLELKIVGPHAVTGRSILADLSRDPRVRALGRFYGSDYLEHLRALAAPCEAQVEFTGAIPQSSLPNIYAAATAVVQPSLYESFGMPIVEAMACERAVVATRAGGMIELIADGEDGLLAEPDDGASLHAALARVLDDEPLRIRLARAGLEKARRSFAWEHVTDAVLRVYRAAP